MHLVYRVCLFVFCTVCISMRRFVIASDGMWDVIDNETVRRLALQFKHRQPADLALHLARKAVHRRTKRAMRGDDITGQGCRIVGCIFCFKTCSRNSYSVFRSILWRDIRVKSHCFCIVTLLPTVLVVDVNPQNAMFVTRLPTDPVGFYNAVKANKGSDRCVSTSRRLYHLILGEVKSVIYVCTVCVCVCVLDPL